jgi:hypothetical protein
MTKLIDKNFLINVLNKADDDRLSEHRPPPNYRVLDKLEITLKVISFFQINGINSTPALLPTGLQTRFPVTLWGLTDYFSGYLSSVVYIAPPIPQWTFSTVGINGFNNNFSFTQNGDMVKQFFVRIGVTDYNGYFIITSSNQIGYGTILNNLSDTKYLIESVRIQVPDVNLNQYDNPLMISKMKINGKVNTDTVNIRTYVKPSDFQTMISEIPLNLMLDKNLIINQYVNYDCQNITYNFKLKKIK